MTRRATADRGGETKRGLGSGTYLLHDTGLALGEGDVATRLVADELDFNLAPLATTLLIVIIVVVGRARARTLDAAALSCAIAYGMRIVELGR